MTGPIQHQVTEAAQGVAAMTVVALPVWMQWTGNLFGWIAAALGIVWLSLRILNSWHEYRQRKKEDR